MCQVPVPGRLYIPPPYDVHAYYLLRRGVFFTRAMKRPRYIYLVCLTESWGEVGVKRLDRGVGFLHPGQAETPRGGGGTSVTPKRNGQIIGCFWPEVADD